MAKIVMNRWVEGICCAPALCFNRTKLSNDNAGGTFRPYATWRGATAYHDTRRIQGNILSKKNLKWSKTLSILEATFSFRLFITFPSALCFKSIRVLNVWSILAYEIWVCEVSHQLLNVSGSWNRYADKRKVLPHQ